MQQLFPDVRDVSLEELAPTYLTEQTARTPAMPFVRAMMISSIDGAVHGPSGSSVDLTNDEDLAMLSMMRACADAVLVGAGTVRAYPYRAPKPSARWLHMRRAAGLADAPRLVIVTRHGLPHENVCFEDSAHVPIVAVPETCESVAHLSQRAEVVVQGAQNVDLAALLQHLHSVGLRRIVCEGGPTLLGQLVTLGLIDELCITTSPTWVGGAHARLFSGAGESPLRNFAVTRVLLGKDSYVYTQWCAQ